MIEDFGGLGHTVPVFATFFMIVMLSSVGVPGLNGFVGEFLILLGAFRAHWLYGAIAATGVILGAWYMLWMYQRVVFGEVTHEENRSLRDMIPREVLVLVPIVAGMIWIGLYSPAMTKRMEASVEHLIAQVRTGAMSESMREPSGTPVNRASSQVERHGSLRDIPEQTRTSTGGARALASSAGER